MSINGENHRKPQKPLQCFPRYLLPPLLSRCNWLLNLFKQLDLHTFTLYEIGLQGDMAYVTHQTLSAGRPHAIQLFSVKSPVPQSKYGYHER